MFRVALKSVADQLKLTVVLRVYFLQSLVLEVNKRVSHKHHFNSLGYLHVRTTKV